MASIPDLKFINNTDIKNRNHSKLLEVLLKPPNKREDTLTICSIFLKDLISIHRGIIIKTAWGSFGSGKGLADN